MGIEVESGCGEEKDSRRGIREGFIRPVHLRDESFRCALAELGSYVVSRGGNLISASASPHQTQRKAEYHQE